MLAGLDALTVVSWAAGLLAAGGLAGVLAGLLGIGGGIIVVPALYFLLGQLDVAEAVRMHVAVGTSLAVIIPTALRSTRAHHRREGVDTELIRQWAPWLVVGAAAGSIIAGLVGSAALSLVFGVVALAVAARMAGLGGQRVLRSEAPPQPVSALIALAIGGLSTLMGIGGGTLSVTVLSLCGYDIRRAVGTAAAGGLIIAIPATLGFAVAGLGADGRPPLSLGYVNVLAWLLIFPLTAGLAPVGARLAHRLPRARLRQVFAGFLALTAVRMILGGLGVV